MENQIDVSTLSKEERQNLMEQLNAAEKNETKRQREAYEKLRADLLRDAELRVKMLAKQVEEFREWLEKETATFLGVMKEYGKAARPSQRGYILQNEKFKLEVKCNAVKAFDERADIAAERLIDFLHRYIAGKETGADDPMYQLAMTLLERNRQGDLDYKSISKLYELEGNFKAPEYAEIMGLFRESNTVTHTATNYYFWEKDDGGVWRRIEPSFCRL